MKNVTIFISPEILVVLDDKLENKTLMCEVESSVKRRLIQNLRMT